MQSPLFDLSRQSPETDAALAAELEQVLGPREGEQVREALARDPRLRSRQAELRAVLPQRVDLLPLAPPAELAPRVEQRCADAHAADALEGLVEPAPGACAARQAALDEVLAQAGELTPLLPIQPPPGLLEASLRRWEDTCLAEALDDAENTDRTVEPQGVVFQQDRPLKNFGDVQMLH